MKQVFAPGTLIQRWAKMSTYEKTPLFTSVDVEQTWIYGSSIACRIDTGDVGVVVSTLQDDRFKNQINYLITPQGVGWIEQPLSKNSLWWWTNVEEAPE